MSTKRSYLLHTNDTCCKKSGGITIVFKTENERYMNFPKTDSEYIQWIKFSKDIFSDEFLLGCV